MQITWLLSEPEKRKQKNKIATIEKNILLECENVSIQSDLLWNISPTKVCVFFFLPNKNTILLGFYFVAALFLFYFATCKVIFAVE